MKTPELLYHFTCDHALNGIIADRQLVPNPHPWLGNPLVWLTDLDTADRSGLGLSSHTLSCDRAENRVTVAFEPHMLRWGLWARQARIARLVREIIEGGGALPAHWWVSPMAVDVLTFDRGVVRS